MHQLFAAMFPEVGDRETRVLHIVTPEHGVPLGSYPIIEFYCTDPDCDCRQVYLHVFKHGPFTKEAEVSFGWEPLSFYVEWNNGLEDEMIRDFKGPALNPLGEQGAYSSQWEKIIKEFLETDTDYVNRLKRHYQMVREKVSAKM